MHHLKDGAWVESTDEVSIASGGAAATNTAHQTFFAANINTRGSIQLTMPDGQTLSSHVICLSYFEPSTGSNALIAELQDSVGQIIPPNQVIYTNALAGDCSADIVYQHTKAGLEQNIVLRSQPPSPAEYGFQGATMLQVWTEFVAAPAPKVLPTNAGSAPDQSGNSQNPEPVSTDQQLDFGAMKIGPGEAFLIDNTPKATSRVRVLKQWVQVNNRTFLVEQIPLDSVASQLQQLPPSAAVTNNPAGDGTKRGHASATRRLPVPHFAQATTNSMQLAKFDANSNKGFLLDYNMTSATNFTFQGDTTYYVSGSIFLAGTNVFEGGCVIKYATNAAIEIWPTASTPTAIFLGTAYHPIICTAKDDDTVGDIISGSSGIVTGYYANPAFVFAGLPQVSLLAYVRISYAQQGIQLSGAFADISHGQFLSCSNALLLAGATTHVRNTLFARNLTNIMCGGSVTMSAENGTFSGSSYLAVGPSGSGLALTNCVLANVTNLTAGQVSLSGGTNGFYISPTFGSVITNSAYPFQSVGGASYYLTNGCSFLNAGTTNINSALLTSLRQKTTWPPIVFSNATISADTTFGPVAARDTGASPSLGYHYEPLDYAFGGSDANGNITFTAGTAVGWFRTSSGYNNHVGHGIHVGDTKTLLFDGRVDYPDYWVRCSVVQEGGTGKWDGGYGPGGITGWTTLPNINQAPWLKAHFTKFSVAASDSTHFRDDNGYLLVSASHCEFWGGGLGGYVDAVQFTNCLLDRVFWWLEGGRPETALTSENCTMHGGGLYINRWNDGVNGQTPVAIQDTAFDNTTFTTQDPYADNTTLTHCDYNAFLQGAPRLYPQGTHDVLVTNFNWQTSWFGNYYLPTNSPLINTGMVTANVLGLFHYTTQTNQTKETNSVVDIGYHYVATDANGKPIDSNSDGIPDYLSDANGNGIIDSGETAWNVANDQGLGIWISRPGNN